MALEIRKPKKKAKKVIHVNRQNIAMNRKDGGDRPTLTVKFRGENYKGTLVTIDGPSVLMDAPAWGKRPKSCGARVWIETSAPVLVHDLVDVDGARELREYRLP